MNPTLYVMVGLPGSGKSTFAQEHLSRITESVYISRDALRLSLLSESESYWAHEKEVYKDFTAMIARNLSHGLNVIADATHLNIYSRTKLINAIANEGLPITQYDIVYVVMMADTNTCIIRDNLRTGRQHVGSEAIMDMESHFTIPKRDEFLNVKGVWKIYE